MEQKWINVLISDTTVYAYLLHFFENSTLNLNLVPYGLKFQDEYASVYIEKVYLHSHNPKKISVHMQQNTFFIIVFISNAPIYKYLHHCFQFSTLKLKLE